MRCFFPVKICFPHLITQTYGNVHGFFFCIHKDTPMRCLFSCFFSVEEIKYSSWPLVFIPYGNHEKLLSTSVICNCLTTKRPSLNWMKKKTLNLILWLSMKYDDDNIDNHKKVNRFLIELTPQSYRWSELSIKYTVNCQFRISNGMQMQNQKKSERSYIKV